MGESVQQHSLDTWVNATDPSRNYVSSGLLQVRDQERSAYIYFARPFPLGASIIRATLRLRSRAESGSGWTTLTVRRTAERPAYSTMTWNSRAAGMTGAGEPQKASKSRPWAGGAEWVFNVTGHMQSVSDGADWSGWRVDSNTQALVILYGVDSGSDYRPQLEVVWSDAPDQPTSLHPTGGKVVKTPSPRLRWDYNDVSGSVDMAGLHLQVAATEDGFASPKWDSGKVAASIPELDLAETSYPGASDGVPVWWRVRVEDGAGLWSVWSDPVSFKYVAPAGLDLLSPTPGGTVADPSPLDDPSPVVSWLLSGATQEAYRVRVWLNALPKRPLWDSGRVTSQASSLTIPDEVLRWDDRLYRIQVDVWDDLDRTSVPGFTAAYSETTRCLLDWDAALTGVDVLNADPADPAPHVALSWERDPDPDGWVVSRNGSIVATLEHADTIQADGTHAWIDRAVPPNEALTYTVRPRVNGRTGWGNPSVTVVSRPIGVWLVTDTDEVCLGDQDEGTWGMGEVQAVHEPIRGDRVVQVRQGIRGYEGSMSGRLIAGAPGMSGVTAREMRERFLRIRRDGRAHLVVPHLSIPVLLAEMSPAPSPRREEEYRASFAFWQRDRVDWDELDG